MKKILIPILVCWTFFSGCTTGEKKFTTDTRYPATEPKSVEILTNEPDRPYESIGTVKGKGALYSSDRDLHDAMRKEAAEMGAQAVIIQKKGRLDFDLMGYHNQAKGIAIRWTGPASAKKPTSPSASTSSTPDSLPNPQPIHQ